MLDYINLMTTTPFRERCVQVGEEDYATRSRVEANAYIDQLERTYGKSPEGSYFRFVTCNHELGCYLDIRFYFDDEEQEHVKYMDKVERGCERWDAVARNILKLKV